MKSMSFLGRVLVESLMQTYLTISVQSQISAMMVMPSEKQSKPRGCRYKCSKSIEIIGERNLRSWRTSLEAMQTTCQAEASIIVDVFVKSNVMNACKVHTFRQVKNTHNNRRVLYNNKRMHSSIPISNAMAECFASDNVKRC